MPAVKSAPKLEQHENGTWYIHWTENRRSKRISTRTKDEALALKVLGRFMLEGGDNPAPDGYDPVIGDALDAHEAALLSRWEGELKHAVSSERARILKERTRQHSASAKPLYMRFGELLLSDLSSAKIRQYTKDRVNGKLIAEDRKGLRKKTIAEGTVRKELAILSAALNRLVREEVIKAGQLPMIPLPPKAPARKIFLNFEERDQWLDAADAVGGAHRDLNYLLLLTAARVEAGVTLRVEHVDLDLDLIAYDDMYGGANRHKRRARVPIAKRLRPVLEAAIAGRKPGDLVCRTTYAPGKESPAPMDGLYSVRKVGKKAYEMFGNEKFLKIHPHLLRHTWATLAAMSGKSMYEIAGVLADDLKTVTETYLKYSPDALRGTVDF